MALVNTDIYNIRKSIEDLKQQYITDEEYSEALSLGIFGYIGDLEAKKIQTAIMMVSELENEVFPNKAKLDKNVITHAIMQNIEDINATPAYMTVFIGITTDDLDRCMIENTFYFDKDSVFSITDSSTSTTFDYHLDYDIQLIRSPRIINTTKEKKKVYSAMYIGVKDHPNGISNIDNPYLDQPLTLTMDGKDYIFLQCTLHQVSKVTVHNQVTSNITIDNKTFTFTFDDQLADFEIKVTENNKEIYMKPVFEGTGVPSDVDYWCYYTYINTDTIRVKFDNASYIPGLNAEIEVMIQTTKGSEGVFTYKDAFYATLESETYDYSNVVVMVRPNTNSIGGVDRKSIEELHGIIPKEMISRGSITTATDLQNYFNMLDTDDNRLKLIKKTDNQIERIYYSYFLMRNTLNNIVPTNSIDVIIDRQYLTDQGGNILVLPAGTMIQYDPINFVGSIVPSGQKPTSEYVYSTIYTIMINNNPLYAALFMCISKSDPYLSFDWVNTESDLQFIAESVHLVRYLDTYTDPLTNKTYDKDTYYLTFAPTQNVVYDFFNITTTSEDTENSLVSRYNEVVKAVLVLYIDGEPYRYKIGTLTSVNSNYNYNFEFELKTDNMFDAHNNIKILDLNIINDDVETNYGYMNGNTEAYIYTLAKLDIPSIKEENKKYDFGDMIPSLNDFVVTNKYKIYNGLDFFEDYTTIMNTNIKVNGGTNVSNYSYLINTIPVIGYGYLEDNDQVFDFIDQINYKKMYVDNALDVLENSFEIDFKFFNTYGPSRIYSIDEEGETSIGRIDIVMKFRMALKMVNDTYTESTIIQEIKNYIEDLNDMGDLHIPNLTTYIETKYDSSVTFFEFVGFNETDANTQHMYKHEISELADKTIPPEFINVRNVMDYEGLPTPDIEIEVLT